MPQLLDLEDIGLGKHELPDDATPDEIKKITDDLVSRNRKSRMAALPATAAEEEGLDKGRVRSAGSSFMQGGVTGVAKPVSFFARMSDMLSAGQLLEASGRTVNPETSKALLQAGTEQANRTPEQRESQLAQDPVYKFGQDLEAGGKEAFPANPKFKGEFVADVLPNAAGGMVPTIAAGAVNPVAAITQYGATSGQQGAEESIAAGDVKDANKVALAYFGLGALTEGMLGVPAYVMRYVRGAKAAGLDKKVVRETVTKMMAKSGAKEAGQESLEQVGQNVVAQQTFDPNRKLSEGVAENAAAGFILGAGVSGGAHGVGTAAANLEKRDRLEVLNELRNSPAWKQHIGNIGDNLQMRELASAASDRVANAIADRQPIKGADARMAGARNRMAGFSYAYDPDSDVYSPVRLEGQNFNASINEVLKGGENNNGQEEKGRKTLLKPEPPPSTTVIDPEKAPAVSDPVVPVKPISMRAQSQEFDRLIVEHGPEFGWDGDWDTLGAGIAEGGSTMAIEGKKRYSRALQALRRRVSGELGVSPDEVDTLAGRANLLIRLKNHIAAGGESDNLEVPNDANTDFLPPEEKPTPKLAPGVNQGDLIASTQKEDLSLAGERATDSERVAKEKADKASAEQAAKDFAAKNQLELGVAKPVAPQAPPQKPVALPKPVEVPKAKKSPTETTPREPSQLERFQGIVKLAADSPNKLRASDADRVMSEANKRPEELEAFRTWVLSKGIPDDTIQEVAKWKPEEAPVEFPFKRPDLPKDVAPGENIFKTFSDRVKAWENQVAQWLKTQSDKKPVIWDEKPTVAGDKEYKGNVKSLTRNIGEKPWRVTTFYERDGKYMPAGHQEYNSREEAMNEEGKNVSKFYDKMPGAVMTEQEISGYQTMDSVPDKSKLVWYQLKGSASELQNKLRGTTIMQTFVRDSLNDGKIAFTEAIDTANDPKRLEYLGLTPVAEAEKVKETSAVPATPQKYRLGKSPQTWTLVERITPTAKEKELGEIPVKVRNDKTGEVQVVLENELTPIKERTAEEKAAAKPKQTDDDKLRELGYTNISTLTTAEKKALIKRGPKGRNLAAPKDEGPAPSLFSEQEQVDFQMSAALRASELRAQANENERLANLRYEAHANGSQRAKGEYVAYKAEANRLRKQAMEFDRMAGNYVRTEPAKVSELKPGKPRQADLFDRDLSNPKRASSLLFSNAANGLRVMFGQNEFNQNYRELRADSPADLMRVLNAPGLNISDDLRNVLRGMISSGTLKNFPGLSFAITEFIQGTIPGETTFTAEHLPDARLIRLLNLATGKDAAHELMHHLQYYLSAADRDYIRTERYRQIQSELAKPRSYNELATLERVLNEQVSSDEFLNNPDNARSLYHLANEYEYFAWMMQDRAADYFKGTFTSGFIARIKKAIKQFLFALKRVSGLTQRHEEIWNEVISGKYEFNPEVRKAFNERIGRNNTKPTDAPFNSGDRLDPDTAWAQIDSASRLTIPKLVADKIADYRAAEAALEAKEYDTAQYKAAKDKISELLIAARRAAAQTGNDYWTSDEGMERLTASSEYLPDAIRELGIQFDPEALRELQKEIRFEGQSRNLASLRRRLRETEATLRMFQDLGFAPDDYAEFSKTAERLAKRIRRLESNNEVDNARGLTLEQRANEIQEINEQEIEFRAKRDALEIPLVNQVFVAPAENGIVPEARLSRTLKGFIAAMNDGSLSRHYKDAIAKLTWDHIRTFENVREVYQRWMEARTKEVSNAIRDANQKIATSKIDVGMLEILRDEIGRVGEGERGLTGTLDGREAVQFLNDSFGTMISFARNLRSAYPNGGAQAILTRLLSSFDGRTDSIAQLEAEIRASTNEDLLSIRDKAGVADYALARIIYVLSRSGKMEDAVGALIRYGTRKMGEIPANNLDQIGTLLDSGDAIQIAEATDRLNAMARQAEARQTFAAAELRAAQRELKQATIALKAAERGKELFDSVIGPDGRPSAEYAEIRSKVIEWLRLSEGMILANGGSDARAGQTATAFKPFSVSAGDVAINQPQVTVDASTEAATKAEDFGRIQHWYDEAEKYVAAYEQADAAFESDPENNPHPEQLGFKGDVYNGLTEALKKKDSYLDPNVLFLEGRVENSPLQQIVMMKGYLGAYFRQMLAAGKNLVGMAGRDVMSKMIDYGNTLAISKKVYGDHRIAIIKARKAALDSHKKYAGNNLELYRTGIFNEMAIEGRQFGVNVTEGMKLPVSGEVVTAEDLKLLRAIQEFYDDLRLNVTEKGGRGIIEKSGTEALGTMKVHIRKAASVGEQGLPMQVSREGDGYIKQIQLAYAKDKEAKVVPAAGDDFTEASKSNIVQFWNKNPRSLIRHILDAGRQFRTMSQDPMMLEAEKRAAQELRSENNPLAINTLDDAIALIAKNLPIDRGINVRRFAETNLLSELEQYHAEAKRQYGESTMLPMAEGIGGLSLRSEFTVPASQFHFPSNWYDYGGLTNHQLTMTTARAMHQRYLDLAMSLERAVAAIEGEIISAEKGGKPVNYKSLKEAVRVKQLTESVIGDLKSSWDVNNPSAIHSNINTVFDVFKSSLLGNITVNIRNVVQGSQLYYNIAQSMERYSRGLALLKALNHIGNTASRVPLDILFSQNSRLGRFNKRMLSGPLNKTLHALKLDFAERIVQNHIDRMTAVQQLGFSQRDPWWDSLKAMWGDTNVQQSVRGEMLNKGALSKVSKVAGNVGRSAVLSYRMIGSEFTDKQINPTAISMALGIEKGLADIARFYGESRKSLGNYNPSDKRWMMQPDEFSNRMSKSGKADNLAQLKSFLSGADITLEPLLWNYYQQYEAYKKGLRGEPTLFNDEQRSALRVAALRALNAGDALNRPSTAAHNAFAKLLLTFQGYSSNYWVNFMSTLKNARSTSKWESVALAFPTLAMTAISMAILGLLSDAITSWYAQWAQGAVQRNVTVFDKEFWTDANKASGATAAATTAMNPLAGDAALFAQSLVVNNRGYEPTGRVLAFSLLNSAFQTMRGMFTLASSGDYANMWNPLRDFFIKHAGLGKEAAYNLSPHMGAVKDYSSGIGAYSFVAQQTGQKEDKAPGQVSSGKSYGPTTGIKEDISADFMRRDPSALMADFQKLVKYYASKGMDDPEAIAKRDFQAMNPIVKAMSGKKPTEEQDAKIMASMSDAQRNSVNKAVAGWNWGANVLGVDYSPVSEPRGSSGGAAAAFRPARRISFGGRSTGMRKISTGSRRIRIGKIGGGKARALRSRKIRLSSSGSRRMRSTRPRMRRIRLV